jgi:hypothetical protein
MMLAGLTIAVTIAVLLTAQETATAWAIATRVRLKKMLKPICVKCGRFFKPKRNGVYVLEQMQRVNGAAPGLENSDSWRPYKLWHADLYEWHGCGTELVTGFGFGPMVEHYMPNFNQALVSHPPSVIVNDC